MEKMFKYCVKEGKEIIDEGITNDIVKAKKAFKHGGNSYGSITEIDENGTSEIGYKKIGGKLYCWL